MLFKKVKTEHHILKDFHSFLQHIEKFENIQRIIPGRISRQQSGRSGLRINFSYPTPTGLKYSLIKGSTAQEVFIIVEPDTEQLVQQKIQQSIVVFLGQK